MTIVDRTLKKGTLIPPLRVRLGFQASETGESLDTYITTGTPVTFNMKARGSTAYTVLNGAATVIATGPNWVDVTYDWQPGDTATPGLYFGDFEFLVGGQPLPAPTESYVSIKIIERS